jgi:hypothetical protein
MTDELYEVYTIVADVLKANDGLCMDSEAERDALASAIVDALNEAEALAV